MDQINIDREVNGYGTFIPHVAVIYDGVSDQQEAAGLPSPGQVEVKLTICYRKQRMYASEGRNPMQGVRSTILEHRREKKETTMSGLFLSELKCVHLSSMLLSPKLSDLGIEPRHHKDVIARIRRHAFGIGSKIEEEKNRRVVLVPINVEVRFFTIKWLCLKWLYQVMNNCMHNDSCAICLEGFGEGKLAVRTPCSHEFHEKCVLKWLLKSPSCPLCRFDMTTFLCKE